MPTFLPGRTSTVHAVAFLGAVAAVPLAAAPLAAQDRDAVPATPNCSSCAEWNAPHAPVRLYGNTYYVGTNGLSALLVTSPDGHVLIDGALPESAPLIRRNIETLGFRLREVKLILNSHAHNDHAGGIAWLAERSGATVAAMPASARWMERGNSTADDPQFGLNAPFPAVAKVRVVADGEVVRVGRLALTAHRTGGHTPGGTTWTWRSCEGPVCKDIVYADSQSPISADDFRYSSNTRYPGAVADFRRAHTLFETLPCDILVMPHPAAAQLWERVAKGTVVDPDACRRLAATSRMALDNRLATEAANPPVPPAAEAWWRHVQVLAHDSLKGRDTGSPGHESAVRYVAQQFAAAGLTPGGTDGWLQRVDFVEVRLDAAGVALAMREGGGVWTPLTVGRDLRLAPRPSTGNVEAPLVFAGYGLSLPQAGVDDLAGLDLKGKIVVHVNAVPKGLSAPLQAHGTRSRWASMQRAGAVGIIAIGAGGAWNEAGGVGGVAVALADTILDDTRGQRLNGTLNPALAARLFAGTRIQWDSVQARVARGDKLPTGALDVTLRATLPTVRRALTSPNVVGVLPGTDPELRNEVVVYTAHTDHTGTFKGPALTGDSIFNGAMDNASGAATLIETARLVAKRGGNKRTLAFVGVTAEEKGLLGSRYFAAHPSLRNGTIVANLNTDMFLPLIPLKGLFAYGYDESELADDLDAVVKARGLALYPDPEPEQNRFVRSDQYSFIRQGIPALAFKVGYRVGTPEEKTWQNWVRDHYHKLTDDVTQPVDFATAAAFNELYADLAIRVANRAKRPAWRTNSFFASPVP